MNERFNIVQIIAEIGINHKGNIKLVKKLIKASKESGADAVKFQYRKNVENFFTNSLEMGSTLIKDELNNINLSDQEYVDAFNYARDLELSVGISFFRSADVRHLCKTFSFDFLKIPSAECTNIELIELVQQKCKIVMLSLGGVSGRDIEFIAKNINFRKNDVIFYCVSNYPVALDSIHFNYMKQIKDKFNCTVGYSSHDEYWEVCLPAISAGAELIERHICLYKNEQGLDISSSSNPAEFERLSTIVKKQIWNKKVDIQKKYPNQGEIQNIKDLGSGYYLLCNLKKGDIITKDKVEIKSPCRGIKAGVNNIFGKHLSRSVSIGAPLVNDDFISENEKKKLDLKWSHSSNIGLPIRFNDMFEIMDNFDLPYYEFHLSYNDVFSISKLENGFWKKIKNSQAGFSIHLPDYISQTNLIDPLSPKSSEIYRKSHFLVKSCVDFSIKIESITNKSCPIVGSFSVVHDTNENTYIKLSDYIKNNAKNYGGILPQFLPKRAWYFGGSVEVDLFCNVNDKKYYSYFPKGICLDTAHLVMACNSVGGDQNYWMKELLTVAGHIHLADAIGEDGEGVNFGDGELKFDFLNNISKNIRLIIEQWEGHLDNFKGFKNALLYIEGIKCKH